MTKIVPRDEQHNNARCGNCVGFLQQAAGTAVGLACRPHNTATCGFSTHKVASTAAADETDHAELVVAAKRFHQLVLMELLSAANTRTRPD
jgi:hypothetical protein